MSKKLLPISISTLVLTIFGSNLPCASADGPSQVKPVNYREKYGCYDNVSMDKLLQKAETLALSKDMEGAKREWSKALNFMKEPRWFPTAAMVPISRRLAHLAEIAMEREQYSDGEDLMRGAFTFPFHVKEDEDTIDSAAEKLFRHLAESDINRCREFLQFAIQRVVEPRREIYRKWEQSLPNESK